MSNYIKFYYRIFYNIIPESFWITYSQTEKYVSIMENYDKEKLKIWYTLFCIASMMIP